MTWFSSQPSVIFLSSESCERENKMSIRYHESSRHEEKLQRANEIKTHAFMWRQSSASVLYFMENIISLFTFFTVFIYLFIL